METRNRGGLRQWPFSARGQTWAAIHRLEEEIAGTISPHGVDGFEGNCVIDFSIDGPEQKLRGSQDKKQGA